MTIAEKVGAERLAELMSELISRSAETISSYDGLLNQFTGDGLMAVFGIPNALEDHAVRACLAALRIRERARMLADDASTETASIYRSGSGSTQAESLPERSLPAQ